MCGIFCPARAHTHTCAPQGPLGRPKSARVFVASLWPPLQRAGRVDLKHCRDCRLEMQVATGRRARFNTLVMPMLAMVVLVVSGCLAGATEFEAEAASHGLAHPPVAIEKQIEFVEGGKAGWTELVVRVR